MIICVDLGATEIKVATATGNQVPVVSETKKIPTRAKDGKEGILAALHCAIAGCDIASAKGIAVATAGTVDENRAVISYATENLPGMTGFNFAEFCNQRFHLPVRVINDAHAALLGEMAYGAGKDFRSSKVAMLTLGSGVGGGYFAQGKIVADQTNDFARFGHICLHANGKKCTCGKRGCVETYLSGRAIHKEAKKRGINDDLFKNYLAGQAQTVGFVEDLRKNIKLTLQKVAHICPFDVCIIGGGVADWMGDAFGKIFDGLGFNVLRATLGNNAGIYGAFANYIAKEGAL